MSKNPFTKPISKGQQARPPAAQPKPKGRVVKQSTTKIEYRKPMSELGEEYLGACNHPFTKKQYEALVKSPKLPPSFLSIRASQPKGNKVCLYASSVFGGVALIGLIGKLKTSCTTVAGKGSKAACEELTQDLERRIPKKPVMPTQPSLHDPNRINPAKKEYWHARAEGIGNGCDFGIGMGLAAAAALIIDALTKKITGRGIKEWIYRLIVGNDDDGTGKTGGDPAGTSTSAAADTASKMVAAVLGMAAAAADKLDDIEMPPVPPVPFDLNPVHPIGSAPIGYENPNYVPISSVASSISWAAVGAWLSSVGTAIENVWAPHNPDTNTWADHKIGEPMAQAGRNMAVAMSAGAQKLMSVKPKNMPTVVFTGLVIVTAPLWVPAVLAHGSLSLVGSMIGPALPELMNEHDKMTGKRTPGPA